MASSLANVVGGGSNGPVSLITWATGLAAAARIVKTIDNQQEGSTVAGKDALVLTAKFVRHASATAGIKIHTWPIAGYLAGTYTAITDHLKVVAGRYQSLTFDHDKGESTVSSPTSTDTQITLASSGEAAKFTAGDSIIVGPATNREDVFSVLSISGAVLQVERAIGSNVVNTERATNYQVKQLKLDGLPVLGHLIVVQNLDATYAHQIELDYAAVAGSVLG